MRVYGFPLVLVLAINLSLLGQDAPETQPPPSTEAAPEAVQPPGAKGPGAGEFDAESPLRQEHVIYLPFEKLRDVFEDEDSSIVLPYAQFLEMWNRLIEPDEPVKQPPVDGVITRADYVGSVKGELVHLKATLDVEVLSAVGVSNLELEIPENDLAVQVTPRRTSHLRSDRKDVTQVSAVLGSTNRFSVRWHPKSGSTNQAAGLANVTDTIAVDVGDGVVHTHAILDYQILRGSLGELIVEVPIDQRLLDVQAPGLREWQTEKVDDHQRVKVRLHAPATEKIRLELHTETPISEDAIQVGQVRVVGVARESGILAVRGAEDAGLEYVQRESITRIDGAVQRNT